jgi:hypothetical protein
MLCPPDAALRALLALDVAEIEPRGARRGELRHRRRQKLRALEVVDDRQEARRGDDLDIARPGRLAAASRRTDDADLAPRRGERRQQHAGHRRQRTVERQFTDREITADLVQRQHFHRGQKPQRDREVEMAAFLEHIGRREVDRDVAGRQREAQRRQRAPHPLPRFGDRLVRQSHDDKGR